MPKTQKLLDRLSEYTDEDGQKKKVKLASMKELLDKLKKRQKKLEEQLEGASGGKEKRLKRQIKVIKAQRKKGLALYNELSGEEA